MPLRRKPSRADPAPAGEEPVTLQSIADRLQRLTWRRRPLGVDERQVWHVIGRLDEMYRRLYCEQDVRYRALLEQARAQQTRQPVGQQAPRPPHPQQRSGQAPAHPGDGDAPWHATSLPPRRPRHMAPPREAHQQAPTAPPPPPAPAPRPPRRNPPGPDDTIPFRPRPQRPRPPELGLVRGGRASPRPGTAGSTPSPTR